MNIRRSKKIYMLSIFILITVLFLIALILTKEASIVKNLVIVFISIISLLTLSTLFLYSKLKTENALLKQSELSWKIIFNNRNEAVIIQHITQLNEPGKIIEVNTQASALTGYSKDEIIHLNLDDIIDKNHSKRVFEEIVRKGHVDEKLDIFHKSGKTVPVLFAGDFINVSNNKIIVYSLKNVSDFYFFQKQRNEHVKKLQDSNEELKKKSERKEDLLAFASHDLRAPFTSIMGFTELLLQENLNKTQERYVKLIRNSAQTQLNYVNGLLQAIKFGRDEIKLYLSEFDICNIIKNLILEIEVLATQKNITITITQGCEYPVIIKADREKITQVFNNLLSNALKFTRIGGKIEIYMKKKNNLLEIHIIDNGIGIPTGKIKGIFNLFEKKDSGGTKGESGTGLGLTICKNIIELHGGEIRVESEYEKGSDFYFTLPFKSE